MTTYEEDIIDIYYNLMGYFTIKNIPFSAVEKRAGGKGRGEIDVLAIKIKNNNPATPHCLFFIQVMTCKAGQAF